MRLGGGHPEDRGVPEPTSGPAGACTTCNGRIWSVRHGRWIASRETVGMVCQTCGTDYAPVTADRDQLAAALVFECELTASAAEARAAVDKLWPAVDLIANERAAAELRAVAVRIRQSCPVYPLGYDIAHDLDARAAALRVSNGEGT